MSPCHSKAYIMVNEFEKFISQLLFILTCIFLLTLAGDSSNPGTITVTKRKYSKSWNYQWSEGKGKLDCFHSEFTIIEHQVPKYDIVWFSKLGNVLVHTTQRCWLRYFSSWATVSAYHREVAYKIAYFQRKFHSSLLFPAVSFFDMLVANFTLLWSFVLHSHFLCQFFFL